MTVDIDGGAAAVPVALNHPHNSGMVCMGRYAKEILDSSSAKDTSRKKRTLHRALPRRGCASAACLRAVSFETALAEMCIRAMLNRHISQSLGSSGSAAADSRCSQPMAPDVVRRMKLLHACAARRQP